MTSAGIRLERWRRRRQRQPTSLAIVVVFLFVCVGAPTRRCSASGHFQLRVLAYRNPRGELADGSCCGPPPSSRSTATTPGALRRMDAPSTAAACSPGDCRVYFRVCLKEYLHNRIVPNGSCTFGNVTNVVRQGATLDFADGDENSLLELPFDFAWTVSVHCKR